MSAATTDLRVLIENLSGDEFQLANLRPKSDGAPETFRESATLAWTLGGKSSNFSAVAYECRPLSKDQKVVWRLAIAAGLLGSSPQASGESQGPHFGLAVSFEERLGGDSSIQPDLLLMWQACKPLANGAITGCSWTVFKDEDGATVVRILLVPTATPEQAAALELASAGRGQQDCDDQVIEARLRRVKAYRQHCAAQDAWIAEQLQASDPMSVDPGELQRLPEGVRVNLVMAMLASLLLEEKRCIWRAEVKKSSNSFAREQAISENRAALLRKLQENLRLHMEKTSQDLLPVLGFQERRAKKELMRFCQDYISGKGEKDVSADPGHFADAMRRELLPSTDGASPAAAWSASDAFPLCEVGEEWKFVGQAVFIDRAIATSVADAVACLNQGAFPNEDRWYVVWVADIGWYSVLPRRGAVDDAIKRFGGDAGKGPVFAPASRTVAGAPLTWRFARQVLAALVGGSAETFNARTRVALLSVCGRLGVPPRLFASWEAEIGRMIRQTIRQSEAVSQQREAGRSSKRWQIAGAALGGGALLAVTGGLAAPLLVGGLSATTTTVVGGTFGMAQTAAAINGVLSVVGTVVGGVTYFGVSGATVVFGTTGVGLTGWKLSKRWGSIEDFEVATLADATETVATTVDVSDSASIVRLSKAIDSSAATVADDVVVQNAAGADVVVVKGSRCLGHEVLPAAATVNREQVSRFFFEHEEDRNTHALHLAVFVSGWLQEPEDYRRPWVEAAKAFLPGSGHLMLKWEEEQLTRLSGVLTNLVAKQVASTAADFWWKSVAMSAATAAFTVSAALTASSVGIVSRIADLDNAWTVVAGRAQEAGKYLAIALSDKKAVGQRPVTLVGHSMGASLIFHCLLELYEMGEYHIVDDVVLLGTPVTTKAHHWRCARAVVSGRLVNGYLKSDWALAFLYRYMEWGISVAGLDEIGVAGVENFDLSGIGIKGHADYPNHMTDILALVQLGERGPLT